MSIFSIDSQWFRTSGGQGLVAGSPLTQFKVTAKGSKILDALEANLDLPSGHEPLTRRLLAKGAIHPTSAKPININEITIVIPTFISHPFQLSRLQKLVSNFKGARIIVVDDCSLLPFSLDDASVIRHETNSGPGVARNTGLSLVQTPFVAFVDDDVAIGIDKILYLAGVIKDFDIHLIAPRIQSTPGVSSLDNYEHYRSALDLGSKPAVVNPTSRVSYVPTAVLVATVDSMRALNGFDLTMRIGEDVDLIWRAINQQLVVRYIPTVTAQHLVRGSVKAFIKQRFQYGSSAADLDRRHRLRASPLRTHLFLLVPPVLVLGGFFIPSIGALALSYLWFGFSLKSTTLAVGQRLKVVTIAMWATAQLFATATARTWWPLFALLSIFSTQVAFLFLLCVLLLPIIALIRDRPRRLFSFVGLYILDNFSYGAGLWVGAIRERSLRCLLPVLTLSARRLRSQG